MSTKRTEQLSMIERIERAMVLLAYFIELDGDVHVPMFEKFEEELKELKKTEDAKSRARQLLALHGLPDQLKAIDPAGIHSKSTHSRVPSPAREPKDQTLPSAALRAGPAL